MPANSTYSFSAGQILTATDLNAVFAQTVAFAADSSNANTGTLPADRLPYYINQDLGTNSSVQFADAVFTGNLIVSGTTTYVNTDVLEVRDANIQIAYGAANSAQANGGGLQIMGANVVFAYDDSSNNMTLSHLLSIGNSSVNTVFGYNATSLSGGSFVGNVNNYFQVYHYNSNSGINSSTDIAMYNDNGPLSNTYLDMGIDSSNYSNSEWTITGPNDAYLYTSGANLAIGTVGVYAIRFFANGSLANNEAMQIAASGNVNIGNTQAGTTSLTVGNGSINTVINSSSFSINSVFTANSTVVNAASYKINTSYVANTTGIYHTGTVNANAFSTTSVSVNTSAIAVGGNVVVNATSHFVGNSSVNTNITAGQISISGQTVNSSVFTGLSYTANNSSYLGGSAAANFVQNTDSRTLSGNLNFTGVNNYFTNIYVGANNVSNTTAHLIGNSSVNTNITAGQITLSGQTVNSSVFTGLSYTANNASYLGGTVASGYQTTAGLSANVATLTANAAGYLNGKTESNLNVNNSLTSNNASYLGGTVASGYQTTAGLSSNVATLSSNNSSYLGGVAAASYLTNTGAFTISGVHTHAANVVFSNGNVIIANGSFGTNTQVLISNGSSMYWGTFSANDALSLNGTNAAFFVQNTDSRTLSGNLNFTGANISFSTNTGIWANGSFGSAGQALTTNGSAIYWSTIVGTNTDAQYTWSNTQTFSNVITFSSSPSVPTAANGTSNTQAASTAYVQNSLARIFYANGAQAFP